MKRLPYIFAACQRGAEPALKREIARQYPDFRLAFSRPGFVTFRTPEPMPADFELGAVFARSWGLSFGAAEPFEIGAAITGRIAVPPPFRLHVFDRGDEGSSAPIVRRALVDSGLFLDDEGARAGELVVDVIVADGETPWLGAHVHVPGRVPWPGGRIAVDVPSEAPSRAYRKLEEALAWSGAPLAAGDHALEFGCAPGGATYALLRRGLAVTGIDPAPMDPVISSRPFTHLAMPVGAVPRAELPEDVQWFVLDMGIAPQKALRSLQRFAPIYRRTLLGGLFTLKLNEWRFADEIPSFLDRIRDLGMTRVRATQLPSAGREILVYGTTERGQSRAV